MSCSMECIRQIRVPGTSYSCSTYSFTYSVKRKEKKIIVLLEQQYTIISRDQGLAPIRVRKVDENAVGLHVRTTPNQCRLDYLKRICCQAGKNTNNN